MSYVQHRMFPCSLLLLDVTPAVAQLKTKQTCDTASSHYDRIANRHDDDYAITDDILVFASSTSSNVSNSTLVSLAAA
jgi:hypothetical protein